MASLGEPDIVWLGHLFKQACQEPDPSMMLGDVFQGAATVGALQTTGHLAFFLQNWITEVIGTKTGISRVGLSRQLFATWAAEKLLI